MMLLHTGGATFQKQKVITLLQLNYFQTFYNILKAYIRMQLGVDFLQLFELSSWVINFFKLLWIKIILKFPSIEISNILIKEGSNWDEIAW
jgi:hypothetical protein